MRYLSTIAIVVVMIFSIFAPTAQGAESQNLSESTNVVHDAQTVSADSVGKPEQSADGWVKTHIREFRTHIGGHLKWDGSIFAYVANVIVFVAEAGVAGVAIAGSIAIIGSAVTYVLSAIGALIAGIVLLVKKSKKPERQVAQ